MEDHKLVELVTLRKHHRGLSHDIFLNINININVGLHTIEEQQEGFSNEWIFFVSCILSYTQMILCHLIYKHNSLQFVKAYKTIIRQGSGS